MGKVHSDISKNIEHSGNERNYGKHQRQKAARKARQKPTTTVNSSENQLQLIMGSESAGDENSNSSGQNKNWAHRAILKRTRL